MYYCCTQLPSACCKEIFQNKVFLWRVFIDMLDNDDDDDNNDDDKT